MSMFSLVYRAEIKGFRYFCLSEAKRCTNALFIPLARVFVNSAWPNFLLPVLYVACIVTYVFIQKQRNHGCLNFTNQSSGNCTETSQLLFKFFFSEPMKVAVCCYCLFNRK